MADEKEAAETRGYYLGYGDAIRRLQTYADAEGIDHEWIMTCHKEAARQLEQREHENG